MYYHGGSKNHGCEAIVRSTVKILNRKLDLYSSEIEEDKKYGIDKLVCLKEDVGRTIQRGSFDFFRAAVSHKLKNDDFKYITISHKNFFDAVNAGDIYMSIGGDNYCYKGRDVLGYYNKCLHKKGAKTVLWGCSFEPGDMTPEIAKDLALYDLIVAREGISYETLKKVNPNTVLLPDPAFQLDAELLPLPREFIEGKTIGINLSPLAAEYGNGDLIVNNYRNLIKYIIEKTDNQVALIPHVVKEGNDDRVVLRKLYEEYENTGRVILLEDCNCMQLKGFIARCRLFVGARTHATIAAYSSGVPTLVVGYSVKAAGIAREIFGTEEHYVLPVQILKDKGDLTKEFKWMMDQEDDIKKHLNKIMPEYGSRVFGAKNLVERL
jgi:polysaccharide pyruvyl transferase WcaK-like protein